MCVRAICMCLIESKNKNQTIIKKKEHILQKNIYCLFKYIYRCCKARVWRAITT